MDPKLTHTNISRSLHLNIKTHDHLLVDSTGPVFTGSYIENVTLPISSLHDEPYVPIKGHGVKQVQAITMPRQWFFALWGRVVVSNVGISGVLG